MEDLVSRSASADEPLVSVVTPVFNGAAYLRESIDSVLAQSYEHWELVVLDNASIDATPEIVAEYAARDVRIRVERNDRTLPIMENWNTALRLIDPTSRFCKVLHADDVLLPECLEHMVSAGLRHPSAAIIAAYRIDGRRVNMATLPYPQDFIDGRELCRRRLLGQCEDPWGSPTSIMYRAADVRARPEFYSPDNPHADTEVCFALMRQGDYAFVHQVLTYTRRHNEAESVRARREGSHGIARLLIAREYGADFLDPSGHARAVNIQLGFQYDLLGSQMIRLLTDREFRTRHLEALRRSGAPLRVSRLLLAWVRMTLKRTWRGATALVRRANGVLA